MLPRMRLTCLKPCIQHQPPCAFSMPRLRVAHPTLGTSPAATVGLAKRDEALTPGGSVMGYSFRSACNSTLGKGGK